MPPSEDRLRQLDALHAMVGRTLGGKYALRRLIGRGGMGAVFEAENVAVGKRLAVKILDRAWAKDEVVASRFAREARAASAVESEHIVSVVDAGSDGECPYIVMELLRGEDLGTRLRRETRVPVDVTLHVVAQVLRGLAAAHASGIVHRDLKPDNVLLVQHAGDPAFAKIVDFGISKIERARTGTAPLALTHKGVIVGTPLYMAPEQARALADVDGRADLYSLGAIAFECLAGRPPHTGESYEQILLSICMNDAPDVRACAPEVPGEVAALIAKALARHREDRFASAARMLDAVRAIAPGDAAARPLPEEERAAAAVTLMSAGTAGPPTDVSWSSGSRRSMEGEDADPEEGRRAPRRARARVIVTAVVATMAGATVTLGVLAMSSSKTPAAEATSATTGTAAPIASEPASAGLATTAVPGAPPTPTPTAAATATTATPTATSPPSPPARPRPAAKPRGLDIQRNLP